jgi:hypothetical protein
MSDVIAEVSLALSYPEPLRVTGPLPSLVLSLSFSLSGLQEPPLDFKNSDPLFQGWSCEVVSNQPEPQI